MTRQRVTIALQVDLDAVPGWGNDAEDYARAVQQWADGCIPHYKPEAFVLWPQPAGEDR